MKDKICGVYKIVNIVTNKFYIGSSKNIEYRWKRHLYFLNKNNHDNVYLQNSYNKYGKDSFKIEVVEETVLDKLKERELFYLNTFKPFGKKGYNILKEATGGDTLTYHPFLQEIKNKMSQSKKNKYKNMTEEERNLFLKRMTGGNHPNFGNKYSNKRKKNISKRVEKYWKENTVLKEKLRNRQTGSNNSFYGKKHSLQTLELYKKRGCKKIVINGVLYNSKKEACEKLKINDSTCWYRLQSPKFINYIYFENMTEEAKEKLAKDPDFYAKGNG